jgi:hypothetical protein
MNMGQVRWAGWTMAVATALAVSGGQVARADVASDKPAAIVVYPKIQVDTRQTDSQETLNTLIRLTNTNQTSPIRAHCFYLNANSHCSGGPNDGRVCTEDPGVCEGLSFCVPGWQEVDFRVQLTPGQPIEWDAEHGLSGRELPIPQGVCQRRPSQRCGSDADCSPVPGGLCLLSNAGTNIPPVSEDPFIGELKCIAVDENDVPVPRNDLKGEAILEEVETSPADFDVASYNAIGIQATGVVSGATNELTLGGPDAEYNGCPNYLILNHFFDDAENPVPGVDASIRTRLVLVPCSEDLLRQIPGVAVVQYLVFNEFEQRFSTSKSVNCYQDIELCNIDTPNCSRSIFNVAVAGTLTGQTRINAIGVPPLPSGMLGIATEEHTSNSADIDRTAAVNLHMQGARESADVITIP